MRERLYLFGNRTKVVLGAGVIVLVRRVIVAVLYMYGGGGRGYGDCLEGVDSGGVGEVVVVLGGKQLLGRGNNGYFGRGK